MNFYPLRKVFVDRLTSFPLGVRQANVYGFGYNASSDRFYVPNFSTLNVYDKNVTGAAKTYQRFSLLDTPWSSDLGPRTIAVIGDKLYTFGNSTSGNTDSLRAMRIYSWPQLGNIDRFANNLSVINMGLSLIHISSPRD